MRVLKFQFTLLTLVCVALTWAFLLYLNFKPRLQPAPTNYVSFVLSEPVPYNVYGWPLEVYSEPSHAIVKVEIQDPPQQYLEKLTNYSGKRSVSNEEILEFFPGPTNYWNLFINVAFAAIATILIATAMERYLRPPAPKD